MTTTRRRRKAAAGAKVDPHAPQPIELHPGMTREQIYAAYGLGRCPPAYATLRNPDRKTYGPAVARIASQLGMPLMPHQRYIVDVALEVDPEPNALAYRDVTALLPRQSGKTTVILPVKVHRAVAMPREAKRHAPYQRGRQRILYAAQKRIDAREKWVDDQLPILDASPFKKRYRARLSNGNEALIWKTGAYDGITSNTETAGHGKVLDLGIEDEFFAAVDARLEQAFSPAMITRWSPQHWRVSTEGTTASLYLATKVVAGREAVAQGVQQGIAYFEFSNLVDPYDDPATWLSCMPALCPLETGECVCGVDATGRRWWRHTVRLAAIRSEVIKLGVDEFCRAYLNRRQGSRTEPDPNVPTAEEWARLADLKAAPSDVLAFGIDTTPTRSASAIVAAWLCDIASCPSRRTVDGVAQVTPHRHLRVIEYRPGTDWVAGRAAELAEKWKPVAWALDPAGAAASLLPELAEHGIRKPTGDFERGQLELLNARDAAAAFGLFVDGIRGDTVRHEDQAPLTTALTSARTRPLGDAGTAWARRPSGGDICPIVAATDVMWALELHKDLAEPDDFDPSAFYV